MDEQLTFEFEPRPTIKGFPELRWTGKRPYRSTQYYPAQLRESYGEEQNGWINKIFWGDNLQVMSHLLKEYRGKVDLIYIDPPFDSKADYKKKIEVRGIGKAESDSSSFEEKQYGDIWTNDEYLQFMYERFILMRELLSEFGTIIVHLDYHKCHHIRLIMDEVFGIDNFRNEMIWTYNGGATPPKDYPRKHDNLLRYVKNKDWTFNIEYRPYNEQTAERMKHIHKGVMVDLDRGTPMTDWWTDIKVPTGPMNQEKNGYPTQKPEKLLERIIKACSNPGDIVFDCFMGSGTTQAVAMKLGRRFIGADINLGAIQTTTRRLLSVAEELAPKKKVTYDFVQLQLSMVSQDTPYYVTNNGKEVAKKIDNKFEAKDSSEKIDVTTTESVKYTGFEVYNVNNYDFFRNPVEARELLIEALEIQPFPQSDVWDGELDGRMVKIMPVNRIATKADLEELKANLPYKTYEKRKEEMPNQPVEKITIVCMGHEPDLKASLEKDLFDYKLDIEIMDILRDKADLQLKREAEAEVVREGNKLVVRAFYPMNLMQKLSLQKEYVEDWRQLVDSIMIDWNYDGVVMQPTVTDVPGKKEMVKGVYDIPSNAGNIKVKITDLLSESLEVEVR
ncbi:MAG: site-specific DNA-methyltransferase [Lachnospiraceae bacterium]|nr:site-specific DNA-methyltransferase [Lachnospiraceae bacterium]